MGPHLNIHGLWSAAITGAFYLGRREGYAAIDEPAARWLSMVLAIAFFGVIFFLIALLFVLLPVMILLTQVYIDLPDLVPRGQLEAMAGFIFPALWYIRTPATTP
jgi:uncharacterized protein YqhQ